MYYQHIQQWNKMLGGLSAWLNKAEAEAQSKDYDVQGLLGAFLTPDQYPLRRQIQASCDSPKLAASRLTGKEAPKHEDTEQSLAELQDRIQATRDYLASFAEADFDGVEERRIVLPFFPDKSLSAADYLIEFVTPNFNFHLTTAYAILRHNGVPLGKQDYIVNLNLK